MTTFWASASASSLGSARVAYTLDPARAVDIIREQIERVRGMIREHIWALYDLAVALIEAGKLTFDQAEAIVRQTVRVDLEVGFSAIGTSMATVLESTEEAGT